MFESESVEDKERKQNQTFLGKKNEKTSEFNTIAFTLDGLGPDG